MGNDPQRVLAVFRVAVEAADGAERAAVLDRECGGDSDLRRRVLALLDGDAPVAPPPPADDIPNTLNIRAGGPDPAPNFDFAAGPADPTALGRLGHYTLHGVLGRGGFGVVLKGFDDKLQRAVAIKVMANDLAGSSPARKRFLREARAAAKVRHENVIHVYAVEADPVPYLVMDLVDGESLEQRLTRDGPLTVEHARRIGTQVARALAAAHEKGLVHRDIKPANILLENTPEPTARVTDFGLARAADDANLTQSGMIVGTPKYMSPEQAAGTAVDHRSDLFSLGSVLYEMLTGRPPFRASSGLAVLKRVANDVPRPIPEVIPDVPEWLCRVVVKLHAKDPAARYQSAREVADALTAGPAGVTPTPVPRSRKWLYLAAAGCALLAVGVAVMIGNRGGSGPTPGGDPPLAPTPAAGPEFVNALGMEFARVPPGRSWLGGGGGALGDKEVEFATAFYLGKYEVTQGEWAAVLGPDANPSFFARSGRNKEVVADLTDAEVRQLPVDFVSWTECQEFVRKLNERVKEAGWEYRLPTELEWEYACRGGPMASRAESAFDFYLEEPTNALPPAGANYEDGGPGRTRKVGSYRPNRLGLFDLHGNVFEHCHDTRPGNGTEVDCTLKGGGYHDRLDFCRAKHANGGVTTGHYDGAGLRLARVPVGFPAPAVRLVK